MATARDHEVFGDDLDEIDRLLGPEEVREVLAAQAEAEPGEWGDRRHDGPDMMA